MIMIMTRMIITIMIVITWNSNNKMEYKPKKCTLATEFALEIFVAGHLAIPSFQGPHVIIFGGWV